MDLLGDGLTEFSTVIKGSVRIRLISTGGADVQDMTSYAWRIGIPEELNGLSCVSHRQVMSTASIV